MQRSASLIARTTTLLVSLGCSSSDPDPPPSGTGAPASNQTPSTPAVTPGAPSPTDPALPEPVPGTSSEADPIGIPLAGDESVDAPASAAGAGGPASEPGADTAAEQRELAALPSVRQEHAVAVLGQELFVIGGFTPSATDSVEAYDPASDSWHSIAAFPSVLHHANVAVVNERLFVAGFYVGSSFTEASGSVYEYDPSQDAWAARTSLPAGTERASACVAQLDGVMYLFGGARAGSVADASAYDVASDTWRELPRLPEPREHCAAGTIDGRIVIAGGRANGIGGFQPNTWIFDPASGRYTPGAPLLTARGGVAGAVLGGLLYLFGGEGNAADPSGVFPQVDAYDPATDSWSALPDMLFPRHGLGAAASNDRIYLPGGASQQGFGAEATHTVFIP